jgi:hypothetical protein
MMTIFTMFPPVGASETPFTKLRPGTLAICDTDAAQDASSPSEPRSHHRPCQPRAGSGAVCDLWTTGEEATMTEASGTRDDGPSKNGTDEDGMAKADGLGHEGTIPSEPGSVGVGAGEPTTFEPEEDPDAAARRDPDAPDAADGAQPTR